MKKWARWVGGGGLLVALIVGCGKDEPASTPEKPLFTEHGTPHGGTAVVLSDNFKMEWVLDAPENKLQVYFLDDDLENFIRLSAPSFAATVDGQAMTFQAVANHATGEKIGDTALFEAESPLFKTNAAFDVVVQKIAVRGQEFEQVGFKFPSSAKLK